MKRLGYLGMIFSFAMFVLDITWTRLCIVIGVLLLLGSIFLIGTNFKGETVVEGGSKPKIDTCLTVVAMLPVIVVGAIPLLLFTSIFAVMDMIWSNFKKQTKPLRQLDFIMTTQKQGKEKVFLFSKGDLVIKIIRYKSYEISFDKGASFCLVTDADIGTKEERQAITNAMVAFDECDYRDKDAYEPTRVIVDFLVKYL